MVICSKRRMYGGSRVEHIISLEWRNLGSGTHGRSSVHALVTWILGGNKLYCDGGPGRAPVLVTVAQPAGLRAFLRTQADGAFDHLLALPLYTVADGRDLRAAAASGQ